MIVLLKQSVKSDRSASHFRQSCRLGADFMKKAGLLKSTRRGYFQITERGLDVLEQNPPEINTAFLRQFEFFEFQTPRAKIEKETEQDISDIQTPEEEIEAAYQRVRQGLATDLLQTIKSCSSTFFERLVIDLLVKMGYGGTRKDAGQAVGRSGDGGIEGIIKEDRRSRCGCPSHTP